MIDDIFLNNLPYLDLHGYDRQSAIIATNDFILENYLLNNKKVVIIHGIGYGIVKNAVQETLRKNKYVTGYNIDSNNVGCTIVNIKKRD